MGIFSFLSRSQTNSIKYEPKEISEFSEYFSEDFFEEIVQNNASMLLYFTKESGWIGANKVFLDAMNYLDIADFRQKNETLRDIFLSESEEIFTEDDKSWLDYIKKYRPEGYELTLANAKQEILFIEAKCYISHSNKNIYILELKDVTEVHTAKLKIKEVETLKSKFLSNIGHEFRTPMNGILGFVEILKKTDLDKKQREYLSMISSSSKSLMTNIETLLDLSQMQGGRLSVITESFHLLEEIEKIALAYCKSGRESGVKVLSFIDPKLPRDLNGDIRKIKQIMHALIQNAVKFTPRGGKIVIEVKLIKRQLNGDCSIAFSVRDNGQGIPPEQLALITEPFIAGNHADKRLGVGLSLSQGLVDLLGSELRIQSELGAGSYFNFVLDFKASKGQSYRMMPKKKVKVLLLDQSKIDEANFLATYLRSFALDVVKSSILDEHVYDDIDMLYIIANSDDSSWMFEIGSYSKSAHVVKLLDDGEKLQTKLTYIVDEVLHKPLLPSKIAAHLYTLYSLEHEEKEEKIFKVKEKSQALVVEDNLINQRLIQILLQEYNLVVSTASNGVEAVKMCEKNKYDIVFMDIDMPQKNGIAATKEIKAALNPNGLTPIVALTAMAMEGDREMLLASGLDDYISKPLTREKLEKILNQYLKVVV